MYNNIKPGQICLQYGGPLFGTLGSPRLAQTGACFACRLIYFRCGFNKTKKCLPLAPSGTFFFICWINT